MRTARQPHYGQSVPDSGTRPLKRRRHTYDSEQSNQCNNVHDLLASTAEEIASTLASWVAHDAIRQCGTAVLSVLHDQPDKILSLAREKLYTWPYKDVPKCWRRLYEDASLLKASKLIENVARANEEKGTSEKKFRSANISDHDALSTVVEVLDMGITLSGQPARKQLFQKVFDTLQFLVTIDEVNLPSSFDIRIPPFLSTIRGIIVADFPPFEQFNNHIQQSRTPLLIENALGEWPALQKWTRPAYLLSVTLDGRRLVPVEIGSSYTAVDWTQKLMPLKQYLQEHILNPGENVGYLAQHDLLSQIPALLEDIRTPDYCFTSPPRPSNNNIAELETPLVNAWFGPAGTRSPLHTDPYHNILCQVVGYKYVRLYAPDQTTKLYPRDVDEAGINMENTSGVEFSFADRDLIANQHAWPLFASAAYQEAILGPGQCLYIPVGWWHFIESLSISFSVSFWWN